MSTLSSRGRFALATLAASPVVLGAADSLARPVSRGPEERAGAGNDSAIAFLAWLAGGVDWLWDHPVISVPALLVVVGLLWVADRHEKVRNALIGGLGLGLLVCLLVLGNHFGHVLALSVPVWLAPILLRGLRSSGWTREIVLAVTLLLGGAAAVAAISLLAGGYLVPVLMIVVALLVIGFVMAQNGKRWAWSTNRDWEKAAAAVSPSRPTSSIATSLPEPRVTESP